MYRSLYEGFCRSKSVVLPTPCSSREMRPFYDLRVAMTYLCALYQFQSVIDTCSAHSYFAVRCGNFLPSQIVPTNQLLSLYIWVPTYGPPSQVLVRVECQELYSHLQPVPVCIVLSFFPNEVEGRVSARPKMHLPQAMYACVMNAIRAMNACLSDVRMSYSIRIR